MHIIFWQNIPSIHQAPFLKALAGLCLQQSGTTLTVICEEDVPQRRKQMGWALPDYGDANVIIKPDLAERQRILDGSVGEEYCHVFSGFDMTPLNSRMLESALKYPCKTAVYLERPQSYPALPRVIRKLKYSYFSRKYRAIDYLFPIGGMAADYYRSCGFNKDRIYPFAYFVEMRDERTETQRVNDTVRFLYVGQNIYRKGVDLIIRALEELSEYDWSFDCIGVPEEGYAQYSVPGAIRPKVNFLGTRSNEETKQIMASSDVLVLPSRFDGWGAVVNEALLSGTQVIVSSEVGAKDLIGHEKWRGSVFEAQSVQGLYQAMLEVIKQGPVGIQDRQKIKGWAGEAITPQKGAQYFLNCLQHAVRNDVSDKPHLPWM